LDTTIDTQSVVGEPEGTRWDDLRALAALALIGSTHVALFSLAVARAALGAVAAHTISLTENGEPTRKMKVEQLMTRSPATCEPDDRLHDAARVMWEQDCGCMPVVRKGEMRPCGMITDRDICMAAYHQGRSLSEIRVRDAMAGSLYTCGPDDALEDAAQTMREMQVRRLPVVDALGNLVGIVSLADIAREAAPQPGSRRRGVSEKEVAGTLASIVRPRFDQTEPSERDG
jgi:CBS domain-containing protein